MRVSVIGAGSWGTALSEVVAGNGHEVRLWARREEVARCINERHRNPDYLATIALSDAIEASSHIEVAVGGADAIVVVTPSKHLRQTAESLRAAGVGDEVGLVICSKGVEENTGLLPVQIFEEILGNADRLAALSGPNHAEEVVQRAPAATVVASRSDETARFFQELVGNRAFRAYTSDDVIGVELCAAFKNVIAIAVGVSYGLGYGDNTAAMLMTRGQAEMSRLVCAAGGKALTCMGLAGTGDLIATCMSQHSRNRTFGEALAGGESLESYERRRHMVVEGALACRTLGTLSSRHDVELPICDNVRDLVWEGADPSQVAASLSSRTMKPEFY